MNNIFDKKPLLEVIDLKTQFQLQQGTVHALNGVNFSLAEGQVLGIVGESGCGKSVTALSLMRLINPPGRIMGGQVFLHDDNGKADLLTMAAKDVQRLRGNKISMIFQDPTTSLNPVLTVGYQLIEPLKFHRAMDPHQAKEAAVQLLDRVGIPQARLRLKHYPHEFSGGMRQRVMIAMALACRPRLLIADEPTTALDVTIQAQIIDLINELVQEANTAVIIITHDMGVIASMADNVAVMYAGRIVEYGALQQVFGRSQHPYTKALMGAVPRLRSFSERLTIIDGAPPSLTERIAGCSFNPRCNVHQPRCAFDTPPLAEIAGGHTCACWLAVPSEGATVNHG